MRKESHLDRSINNLFIISIALNIIFFVSIVAIIPETDREYIPYGYPTVTIGYGSNPFALDPVNTWGKASREIQRQVTQSLVEYDLSSNPQYKLKPVLAESWVWENKTRISFKLREDVFFHDGTRMTAEDVKWNFERVKWFCNASGSLQENATSWEAFPSPVFFLANSTFIFESFEANDAIDPLNFTINLNAPFSALLDLLTFGATNILSPDSTPRYTYVDLATDDLIGTGPYSYVRFVRDREVRLVRNDLYWGFPGYFEVVVFRIIEDETARMTAGLAGLFDYIGGVRNTYLNTFKADDDFYVEDVGEDLCYFYLEVYCGPDVYSNGSLKPGQTYQSQKNNATLRRAIALAINYTYIYEEIQSGLAVEGTTAVPRAMPGYNASVVQASDYNHSTGIEMARNLMKTFNSTAAAWDSTLGGTNEADWTGANLLGRNLEINGHFGSTTNLRLNQLLITNLSYIGIKLDETIREWPDYIETGEKNPWEMDIAYIGWCPNYLNPYRVIDPLFNLKADQCFSRVNDTSIGGLTNMMKEAINEINRTKQLETYGNIQSYIFDVNRSLTPASHAHISGWVYKVHQIHKEELKGVHYNVMELLDVANWYY